MKWKLTQLLALLGLLILVFVSIDWQEQSKSNTENTDPDMAQTRSDYYMEEFETVKYDDNGQAEYQLIGTSLLHYPMSNTSRINMPKLTLNRTQEASWQFSSNTGLMKENDNSLQLVGTVIIHRHAIAEQPAIIIKTDTIDIFTKTKLISTDAEVVITSRDWVLRSNGLTSNLRDGKLFLLSNVRAHYEIKP